MKFLLDQDVYADTEKFIKNLEHDVITAYEIGCSQASDLKLLQTAKKLGRILVTRDRDFGALVFLKEFDAGVIYLRILPSNINSIHKELEKILSSNPEDQLKKVFIVVEPGRHRIRKLPNK